ncbi:hypothetical protein BACCAP_00102 [Pseudoflavonifractor capillosus ATCC 29799]|uniref:Uncharacterized protein n=1 Tax=Pseudoflavonifractor capillosus ATCC 29799 TaxID=411467 RepID=A6NPI8_9FIRM|nr:hypothetical protein BACCAP_00102 [Pseudoflavonifractor capillosus ATCC 29799]
MADSRIFIEHYYNGFSVPVQLTILPLNAKIPPVPLSLSLAAANFNMRVWRNWQTRWI